MKFAHHRFGASGPDLTPMVDVVFLLLIFFLTTTQMAQAARTRVELPHEAGEKSEQRSMSALVVNVDETGGFIVLEDAVSPAELTNMAEEAAIMSPTAIPIVRADLRAPSERLNQVANILRKAGFSGLRLATMPEARP
ncbi:MAG: biopolymer transporter ExbD [Planctomycetota bacterium]|nr:biopolymer transporter ExbD [Planctomycetota bacterium]